MYVCIHLYIYVYINICAYAHTQVRVYIHRYQLSITNILQTYNMSFINRDFTFNLYKICRNVEHNS